MLLGILEKKVGGKAGALGTPTGLVREMTEHRAMLRVECLEPRCVPAAIRLLPGFTSDSLGNVDELTAVADVGFDINFLGTQTNQVLVDNNGFISLVVNNPIVNSFTLNAMAPNNSIFTLNGTPVPVIAPFHADVDTSIPPVAGIPFPPPGVVTFGQDTLAGHRVFGVSWIDVGYFFLNYDKLNQFQLILIERADTGPGNFDIEFNYDQIAWETGDFNGGVAGLGGRAAQVGYTDGTGVAGNNFSLLGSGIPGALIDGGPRSLTANRQLSSTPGRYHFLVREGQVLTTLQGNLDITAATRSFRPYRYLHDSATQTYRGNLTLLNVGGRIGIGDEGLDLFLTNDISTGPLAGPVTVVIQNLPPGVQVVNRTGITRSGNPFITVNLRTLTRGRPLRIPLVLTNPLNHHLGTYFQGFDVRAFSGTFDPRLA